MRLARLFAVPAIAGVVLAFTIAASPAYASATDMACNYDYVTFNACLSFQETDPVNNMWRARVGLDALMPERYAQEIVAYGAGFRATLWGDDNGQGTFIADLSVSPGWPFAGSDRLSGELTATLTRFHVVVAPRPPGPAPVADNLIPTAVGRAGAPGLGQHVLVGISWSGAPAATSSRRVEDVRDARAGDERQPCGLNRPLVGGDYVLSRAKMLFLATTVIEIKHPHIGTSEPRRSPVPLQRV
jgi:hypothetical protein